MAVDHNARLIIFGKITAVENSLKWLNAFKLQKKIEKLKDLGSLESCGTTDMSSIIYRNIQ